MPKFPDDMDAARAHAAKEKKARDIAVARRAKAAANDAVIVREFANDLRRKQGLPDLRPDEPVEGFFCRRGRR